MGRKKIIWDKKPDGHQNTNRHSISDSIDSSNKESYNDDDFLGRRYSGSVGLSKMLRYPSHTEVGDKSALLIRCFKSVIWNCLNELNILQNYYKKSVEDIPLKTLEYRGLQDRFGDVASKNYREYRINMVYTDLHKLNKEVLTLVNVLTRTLEELRFHKRFPTLLKFLEDRQRTEDDENNLLGEVVQRRLEYNELRQTYVMEKEAIRKQLDEMNAEVHKLLIAREDQMVRSIAEVSYVKKWEATRREQNHIVLTSTEDAFISTKDSMRVSINREKFCHEEIKKFLDELREDHFRDIQYWMDTYDKELEEKENAIYNLKVETENITLSHESLKVLFEGRQKEINDWLEYKRVKKEKDDQLALETWAAIKIQAWWRGTMYRKQLGPYRKKKGKKDKDKKKKGKKK